MEDHDQFVRQMLDIVINWWNEARLFLYRQLNHWVLTVNNPCIDASQTNQLQLPYPNSNKLNCQTLMDVRELDLDRDQDGHLLATDIKQRWQLCQPPEEEERFSPNIAGFSQHSQTKPKGPIIFARPLHHLERNSKSRQSNRNSDPMLDEEDLLLDSASVVTDSVTNASTVQQAKIGELEQQLQLLQKQMQVLLTGQQKPNCAQTSAVGEPKPIPQAPIPPPPPLPLPSLFAKPSKIPSSLQSQSSDTLSKQNSQDDQNQMEAKTPGMRDILKDLGNVKLRKVNRSPEFASQKPKTDMDSENDPGLASSSGGKQRDNRSMLMLQIQEGVKLKHVEQPSNAASTDKREQSSSSADGVAAILRKRMEHCLGDSFDDSSDAGNPEDNDNDNEWDD